MLDNPRFPALGSLAVVMPVYNEEELAGAFLEELDAELREWPGPVRFFVVNDASTDGTHARLLSASSKMGAAVEVVRNSSNRGHGPSTARGYAAALGWGADVILQTDSDAPFYAREIAELAGSISGGADIAHGVRLGRSDPWFRRVLTAALTRYLSLVFRTDSSDPNSPVRMYRSEALVRILQELPSEPLVPSLFATIVARHQGLRVAEVDIKHRPRPDSIQGVAWGRQERRLLIPRRLMSFVLRALVQSVGFRLSRADKRRYDSIPSPLTREAGETLPP